jgi:hypothetical protein
VDNIVFTNDKGYINLTLIISFIIAGLVLNMVSPMIAGGRR